MDKSLPRPEQGVLLALLRELRREAGPTQVEPAGRLVEPQPFTSNYESEGQNPVTVQPTKKALQEPPEVSR